MTWTCPEVGNAPKARADATIAYDNKGSRLVLFGGWTNRWLGDLHVLNVDSVVGPPYAILDVEPKQGPITGSTTLIIIGLDFISTETTVVRCVW
jgi:dynein heavy chain